jgi:hypothetical protein
MPKKKRHFGITKDIKIKLDPEEEIEELTKERDFWQAAYMEQRMATGRAWWQGYEFGKENKS